MQALLQLSLGPSSLARGAGWRRALFGVSAVVDSLLSRLGLGDPPLQTLLTTSLAPFAEIRRERDWIFGASFPSDEDFQRQVIAVAGNPYEGLEGNPYEGLDASPE